jgi:hypothetical protein
MASQHPPRSSDILFALEQALREVWAVLKAHDPNEYLDKDGELQKAIAGHADGLGRLWGDRPTRTAP